MSFFSGWTGSNSFGGALDFLADRWDSIEGYFDGSTAANRQSRENEHNAIFQYFANKALQEQAQEFNADQSALAFQRSLKAYRQRYQDTVKDLRAAGLNPLLAVNGMSPGQSPSATPASSSAASVGLPSASLSQGVDVVGSISNLVGAYSGIRQLGGMLANTAADTALKETSSELNKARALEASANAAHKLVETEEPGVIGQGYRALKKIGSQWADNISDMFENATSLGQTLNTSAAGVDQSKKELEKFDKEIKDVVEDARKQYSREKSLNEFKSKKWWQKIFPSEYRPGLFGH